MNYDKLVSGNSDHTQHPNSAANLRPFPPGVSGNPSGRPKKSLYMREMEKAFNDPEIVPQLVEATIKTICSKRISMAGVLERAKLLERIEGPITQEINLSGSVSFEAALEAKRRFENGDTDIATIRTDSPSDHRQFSD